MDKLENIKDEEAEDLEMDARESARYSLEAENQLSSSLISITLAFVALIATAISTSNVLYVVVDFQKWIIMIAMIIFCVSILVGLISYFYNIDFHHRAALMKDRLADRIDDATSSGEVAKLRQRAETANAFYQKRARTGKILLMSQIVCAVTGLVLTVTFVSSLLFYTATTEDYTEDLPIYEEIMEEQEE